MRLRVQNCVPRITAKKKKFKRLNQTLKPLYNFFLRKVLTDDKRSSASFFAIHKGYFCNKIHHRLNSDNNLISYT